MFVRRVARQRSDGSTVRYVQLARSFRDDKGRPRTQIIANLGREDQLDVSAIQAVLVPLAQLAGLASPRDPRVVACRVVGTVEVLRAVWEDLGLHRLAPRAISRSLWVLVCADLLGVAEGTDPLAWCRSWAASPELDDLDRRDLRRAEEFAAALDPAAVGARLLSGLHALGLHEPGEPLVAVLCTEGGAEGLCEGLRRAVATRDVDVGCAVVTARGVPIVAGKGVRPAGRWARDVVRWVAQPDELAAGPWVTEVDRGEGWAVGRGRFRRLDEGVEVREVTRGELVVLETRAPDRADVERARDERLVQTIESGLEAWCGACDPVTRTACCLETAPVTRDLVRRTPTGRLQVSQAGVREARRGHGVRRWLTTWAGDSGTLARAVVAAEQVDAAALERSVVHLLAEALRRVVELRAERTWAEVRSVLDTVVEVELELLDGSGRQRPPASPAARELLQRFGLGAPPQAVPGGNQEE
ncbi:MAG: hypothetical protein H6732_08445 [Alphaproteobacteria bacterium]|nr:hypothetical protein [Alphaproteobacteria bacterium]